MKKARLLLAEFFVLFIAIIAIGSLIAKDRDFSENENRFLAEMPKFTIEGFLKGDFQEGNGVPLERHSFSFFFCC